MAPKIQVPTGKIAENRRCASENGNAVLLDDLEQTMRAGEKMCPSQRTTAAPKNNAPMISHGAIIQPILVNQ